MRQSIGKSRSLLGAPFSHIGANLLSLDTSPWLKGVLPLQPFRTFSGHFMILPIKVYPESSDLL